MSKIISAIVNFFKRIFGLAEKHVDETVTDAKAVVTKVESTVKADVAQVTDVAAKVKSKI